MRVPGQPEECEPCTSPAFAYDQSLLKLVRSPDRAPRALFVGALDVTCSIGFALSADAESGAEWLIGRAREARHAAQCEGGDRVVAAVCYGGLARHARR